MVIGGVAVEMAARATDQVFPGWALKVNLDDFDLFSCRRCVIGYAAGLNRAFDTIYTGGAWTAEFKRVWTLVSPDLDPRVFGDGKLYGALWRELIAERQATARLMAEEAAKLTEEVGVTI